MNFKELVFNITFTIWLVLVTLITVSVYFRTGSLVQAVNYVNQLRVKDTQELVKGINTLAKRITVPVEETKKK